MSSFQSSSTTEDIDQWRNRITSIQRSKQSPESIAAAELRSESKKRLKKNSSKAKRLQTVQAFTKCSNAATMASMRSVSSAPARFYSNSSSNQQQQQQMMLSNAFGAAASSKSREEAMERAECSSKAMHVLQQAANVDDESEADHLIEEARLQLANAGHAWTAFGSDGAEQASRVLGDLNDEDDSDNDNDGQVEGGNKGLLNDLLSDLKSEPTNDEDCSTRFQLYEEHTETVSSVRKSLLEFWDTAKEDVPSGAAKESIEASLVNIDHSENLEVYMNPKYWFVYSMARKVTTNETKLGMVLREIQTKLDLLASTEDCPICLEMIENKEDEHVFGCAHKVHQECWNHWSTHCTNHHKQPFCPLCRNDEFLEDILS